jgi:nucleotide-binding universal stress UspA family protein
MFKKILVPLDGSKMSESVLPYVRELAQANHAEVYVMEVAEPLRPYNYPQGIQLIEPIVREMRAEANAYVHKMTAMLNDQGIRAHGEVTDAMDIANAILSQAEAKGADLIAIATHGRSGASRWLLGSVADKVIHSATVPVLLVRPDLSNSQPS